MTALVEPKIDRLPASFDARIRRLPISAVLPTLTIAANAIAFFILRPGVNDLWAARARASAARHGVGLFYWFGWFGGGSTPGNYSVLTPFVSALMSSELLGAVSAVGIVAAATYAVRGTQHPVAASWIAVAGAAANLWSGRIPFLFGTLFAVGAFIAVRHHRTSFAAALGVLSVFCSPVSGAFIALAMVATFVPTSMKDYRRISMITLGSVGGAMIVVAIVFGNPGPQHFSYWLLGEIVGGLVLFLFARPPEYLRFLVWLSIIVAVLLYLIPNGMGSNLMRWGWFYLPVAIVATSGRRFWVALALVATMVVAGAQGTISDLQGASQPTSSVGYYKPLANELDRLPDLTDYRLEVVTHGSHTGDDTLLSHAMLARGWETQEDDELNGVLADKSRLNPATYEIWLHNNAVGYVAIPRAKRDVYPEYELVASNALHYLTKVWDSKDWILYRVANRNRIVNTPAKIVARSQSRLTINVPCTCQLYLRVRYSKYLGAHNRASGAPDATVTNDGSGWSVLSTKSPGVYYLEGSISGLFR